MNTSTIRTFVICLLLLAAQVVVFNRLHLFGYATPLMLIYAIIILPLNTPRWLALLLAFAMGLISDIFTTTPGVATTTLTLAAFVQQPLLRALLPADTIDDICASRRTMGTSKYLAYTLILTVLYCTAFFLVENCGFTRGIFLLINIGASTALTYLLILTFDTIRKG